MNPAHDAIDASIRDVERLRSILKRNHSNQVRSADEKSLIKATGLTWFNNYRNEIARVVGGELLHDIDNLYKEAISASDRSCTRLKYYGILKAIKDGLSETRGYTLTPLSSPEHTTDEPPNFAPLIADQNMKQILERRWRECFRCIQADAPLAATVMMGGLLEALLLARINKEPNKTAIFKASRSPKDKKTGMPLPLNDWTLRHYIEVAHELKWITPSVKDVGSVLRDYRNYVHPQKELSHGVVLEKDDAILFWEISKNIAHQLL